jgi:hypothetical protein
MTLLTVTILPGGRTAREKNPHDYPSVHDSGINSAQRRKGWQDKERLLRTFEIDFSHLDAPFKAIEKAVGGTIQHVNCGYESGQERQAELLENGKIKIL